MSDTVRVLRKATALILILACVLSLGAPVAAEQQRLSERDQMTLRVLQLAQAGRLSAARDVMRDYLEANPTDGTMYYNLTCLDVFLHETEQAMADLQLALENGYSNFRLLQSDPDLNPLREDDRFADLVSRYEDAFLAEFQDRSLFLDEGYPLVDIPLQSTGDVAATATVAYDTQALHVGLSVQDDAYDPVRPPWQGGCGMLVNLVLPLSLEEFESRRYISLGFSEQDGRPVATLVARHGQVLLQPLTDIVPVVKRQDGGARYEVDIPWSTFAPYGPPLDLDLGLNVFYFGSGDGEERPTCALMPEYKPSFDTYPWRRFVTVSFNPSERTVASLKGRLYSRLLECNTLGYEMALWSETAGQARCRLTLHPAGEPDRIVETPTVESFTCERELNFFNTSMELTDLPMGSYTLQVDARSPDGTTFTKSYPFDNFTAGWINDLNQRIHALSTPEASLLKYHLFDLAKQVEQHHPFDDASGFHVAYADLVRQTELCEQGQSCLPESGFFRGGFTSGTMTQRACSIFLPPNHAELQTPHLLMVLPPAPGTEDALARDLGRDVADRGDTIVLVPQSHGYSGLSTDAAARHAILAMAWAQELFPGGTLTLVGMGDGTDAALEASLRRPDLCYEVLLDADQLYRDLQTFDPSSLAKALGSRPNTRPYSLVSSKPGSERTLLLSKAFADMDLAVKVLSLGNRSTPAHWLANWYLAAK